jgi:hypothetical protein
MNNVGRGKVRNIAASPHQNGINLGAIRSENDQAFP